MGPLGLLLVGLGFGIADREVRAFERSAARQIAQQLTGEDLKIAVEAQPSFNWGQLHRASISASQFSLQGLPLFTEPRRSRAGKLDLLQLRLSNFNLRGLKIKSLEADIPDCRFDLGLALKSRELRLSRSGTGRGKVVVAERDLAGWIEKKYAEITTCTVKIDRDVAWVEGQGDFLFVKTQFTVIARLTPINGTKLHLTNAKIYFDWKRAEPAAADVLLRTLNPVVDLDKDLRLHGAIQVDQIRLRGGVVEASGQTKIPNLPSDHSG